MDPRSGDDMRSELADPGPVRLAAVHAALGAGEVDRAIALAEAALQAGGRDPLVFNLLAHRRQVEGRYGEAMGLLETGLRFAPDDAFLLCALAGCLSQQGRDVEALRLYNQVLASAPLHAQAHHGRGLALDALDEAEPARSAYLRAVELAPEYPDALGALANHALRRGELDQARSYAGRALAADFDEPAATLVLASIELKRGEPSTAADRLERRLSRPGLSALHQGALGSLYADALDRLDRPEAAMQAHARANAAIWAVHGPQLAAAGVEPGVDLCRRLQASFARADPADWHAAPAPAGSTSDAPAGHVFLVGFVRSGTTLLEQVLASHPQVVALEEQPLLRGMAKPWFGDDAALHGLATLDEVQAEVLRTDYWRRVRAYGVEPAGRIFIDKNPLDGVWLPLVAKLF
ncbi:tetratricopeptide repeat-containing sulfotransferase family protein, partial [Caulobacter sp. S45]|uniref:tetratricopeptide repeat-containing sulfotransferase family protein n=1 Tax=Caulobacter sp. S45 TaxID=1641861 RepID=UPI001575D304